jgi:hypothetical protein
MFNMNIFFEHISALQKSIRRRKINRSRYFAKQLMDMVGPDVLFSQLRLYAAEDVGLADPSLLLYERKCSDIFGNKLKECRIKKSQASKNSMLWEVADRAVIAAAISWKSRLFPMASFVTLWDIYQNENFSGNVYKYFDQFVAAVEKKDEKQALYYAYVAGIFYDSKDKILNWIQRQGKSRKDYLIQKWAEESKRNKEWLVFAGSVVLLCRDVNYTHGEYKNAIDQYLLKSIKPEKIPDYAYDKHTLAGKKRNLGLKHFFKEGAFVENERFPNDWKEDGTRAYLLAEKKGLEEVEKLFEAIEKKRRTPNSLKI